MGRTAAARTLSGTGVSIARRFDLRLGAEDDDGDIRRLLREHALPGDVVLTFEREPDSRIAAAIEGYAHQTMVARERKGGRILGIASRAERDVFLNGQPGRLGYLGQLRADLRGHRVGALLDEGFAFCRTLHEQGNVAAYLTSIVEDNHAARRLVCGLGSAAAPRFVRAGSLVTLAMPRARRRAIGGAPGIEIRRGSVELLPDIVACLDRNGRRYQFTPRWTADDLLSPRRTPGLEPRDFLVAIAGGRVAGCAATWDQRGFKQVIVQNYSQRLARWRRVVNLAGPWVGVPALPAVGRPLQFVYLSHVAVDDDRPDVTAALVAEARCRLPADASYMVTAFAEGSPLLAAATRVARHRRYRSVLYLGCWPDGQHVAESIDGRHPHPEVAIL
jgi:hypothetical protein